MSAIDDFKAEYARQNPQRPPKNLWSDEALVIAALLDKMTVRIANLERKQFNRHHRGADE